MATRLGNHDTSLRPVLGVLSQFSNDVDDGTRSAPVIKVSQEYGQNVGIESDMSVTR